MSATAQQTMLEAALGYAAQGWPVFPLKPREKVPATAHGLKDASVDPEQIRQWWTRTPNANIGFATGHGVVILDVDDLGALTDLQEDANASALDTSRTETSDGCYQLFFRTDAAIRNSAGKLRPGLDVRGAGGYVVLPPSVHPSGHVYRWDKNGTPGEMPGWLLKRLTSPLKPAPKSVTSADSVLPAMTRPMAARRSRRKPPSLLAREKGRGATASTPRR